MKISEVIKELEKIKESSGDLEVTYLDTDYGFVTIDKISTVDLSDPFVYSSPFKDIGNIVVGIE